MTYPATPTFWLERTDQMAWGLRRYSNREPIGGDGYHSALVYLEVRPAVIGPDGYRLPAEDVDHSDPRWPTKCSECAYTFVDGDHWQVWTEGIWVRSDTGERFVLHQSAPATSLGIPSAPPGACWDAHWMGDWAKGPDGICLMVRLPNGHDWMVDAEASNCTRPGDRSHRCWVRSGDPRTGSVTVGKDGETCSAGAGSIAAGDYHGFLTGGVLTAG
ncbi:MAG: hypothetical protein NVS3B1_06000 [Marmoricola sp.]